jgi:hypothetical protein
LVQNLEGRVQVVIYKTQNIREIKMIPLGFYQHSTKNKFCLVEGFSKDTQTKEVLVLHKRFSDGFKQVWSCPLDYFVNKYEPRPDWHNEIPSSLERCLEESITVTLECFNDVAHNMFMSGEFGIKKLDALGEKHVYTFKSPEFADKFTDKLDDESIQWE